MREEVAEHADESRLVRESCGIVTLKSELILSENKASPAEVDAVRRTEKQRKIGGKGNSEEPKSAAASSKSNRISRPVDSVRLFLIETTVVHNFISLRILCQCR